METYTLGELLESHQNQLLSLSVHMDCLIEELEASGVLNSQNLNKRIKKKIKKLQSMAVKLKEKQEIPPINYFGGPIGEA